MKFQSPTRLHRAFHGALDRAAARTATVLAGCLATATLGLAADLKLADYTQLQEAELCAEQSLGAEGKQWQVADARFFLDSGTVRWLQPVAGQSTGLVFEGSGRFQLPVLHPAELRQLRRFAEDPTIEGMSFEFQKMVLRGTGLESLLGVEPSTLEALSYSSDSKFGDTMKDWIRNTRTDADARVVAALLNPGDRFVQAEFDTKEYGTVIFQYDEGAQEEISVVKIKESFPEQWVSLDRPEERREDGSPNSTWTDQFLTLVALDAEVDVTKAGKGGARGVGQVNPVIATYKARATYKSRTDGLRALRLRLTPWAEVTSVTAEDGTPLEFMRYHFGSLGRAIPKELYDGSLVVLLPEPLSKDEEATIALDYEMEMGNFASLLSWYPNPVDSGFRDYHTIKLAVTHRKDYDVRAMGNLVEQREEGRQVVSVWETSRPVDSGAFTIARLPYEKDFEFDGLPTIYMFGTQAGSMSKDKIEQSAPDVINAVNYFQNLFGSKVGADNLYITYIASGHGQAGQGFIHISDSIAQYAGERASGGTREAFLAHEVAHEWWGHQLSWASYRDQWLSEGLAEYAAMMFLEASLEDGDKILRKMVQAYHDEVNGSLKSAFGAFARPGLAMMNRTGRDRIGPIGHGYRAGTTENPAAYQSMAYTKGSLVMHSLRNILRIMSGSDELFTRILRDFVQTHHGGAVRTEDLLATIQKHARSPYWPVFFDQFVFSNDIPTLDFKHEAKQKNGEWVLSVDVEQKDVPLDFKTAVPLRVDFGRGKQGDMLLMVDAPTKHFEFKVPAKPKKVFLNPDGAVLARVE